MKRRTLAGVVLVAIALVLGWQFLRKPQTPAAATAPPASTGGPTAAPGSVELAAGELITLEPGRIARSIPLTGTLRATQQTLVRAKVAGELIDIQVREGVAVGAGQRIALIDPVDFEARVREREAQLRSAEAQLEQARRTRDNNRQLLEKNFISQNAFDNAQSGLDVAVANKDAAGAQLAQARKALADTAVLAPMAGMVGERFVQVGEKVSPDTKIVSIIDLSRMEIEAPVPSSEIGGVRIGQPVNLRIEGIDAPQTGTIARINPATSAGTRSVPVYITLDNRDPRVRAGLFAQGALAVEQREAVIAAPLAALRESSGRSFVYAVVDGRIEQRSVQTGIRDETARAANGTTGLVEIIEGLKAGDTIVAVNLGVLRSGSAVRTVAPERDAGAAPDTTVRR